MESPQQLAERYAAAWNASDPHVRRHAIAALWTPSGVHYVRELEARGYDALEKRIAASHEKNVRQGGNSFRVRREARSLRNVVTFGWEMARGHSEEVLATGFDVLVLDAEGRIEADYQFVVS